MGMDKFDLHDMECEFDVVSGTEAAYVRKVKSKGCDEVGCENTCTEPCDSRPVYVTNNTHGPTFRNDYAEEGCGFYEEVYGLDSKPETHNQKAARRKATPVYSGVLMYFPDAIQAVARCSQAGNDQHHPEKALHWDRSKSQDEKDALVRHLMDAGSIDDDGIRHSAKVAWRALANLQKELEANHEAELSKFNGIQWEL